MITVAKLEMHNNIEAPIYVDFEQKCVKLCTFFYFALTSAST